MEIDIFQDAHAATERAREVTTAVSDTLNGSGFLDIEDIQTILTELWSATSVRVTMRKYA